MLIFLYEIFTLARFKGTFLLSPKLISIISETIVYRGKNVHTDLISDSHCKSNSSDSGDISLMKHLKQR